MKLENQEDVPRVMLSGTLAFLCFQIFHAANTRTSRKGLLIISFAWETISSMDEIRISKQSPGQCQHEEKLQSQKR